MNFCSACAHPVHLTIPHGDNRPRHVCTHCGMIHYQNPKMVLGTIPVWDEDGDMRILLCRRAIEPRRGFWTLPAGFMENNETTAEAAMRETIEEAGAHIEIHELFSLLNVPHVHQVHMFYRATLLDLDYEAGVETLEIKMFAPADIPWEEIAFQTVSNTLTFFLDDHAARKRDGTYQLHTMDILKPMPTPPESIPAG
ncbi:NUDIX hydrolase [uncultured Oxalicibacterium sp.]|uniref:NUDIX hydrolase n=1 Tax=uncultured Oxalicibacterium sp. TaxID=1168540 RepID=UPI0025E14347|nr:NUDIX hydrolase [uncultured Oxalicibacterium sp.]